MDSEAECIISFSTEPGQGGDSDLRATYCAFAISSMLDDWSGVDVDRALMFVASCRVWNLLELGHTLCLRFLRFFLDIRGRIWAVSLLRGTRYVFTPLDV